MAPARHNPLPESLSERVLLSRSQSVKTKLCAEALPVASTPTVETKPKEQNGHLGKSIIPEPCQDVETTHDGPKTPLPTINDVPHCLPLSGEEKCVADAFTINKPGYLANGQGRTKTNTQDAQLVHPTKA